MLINLREVAPADILQTVASLGHWNDYAINHFLLTATARYNILGQRKINIKTFDMRNYSINLRD